MTAEESPCAPKPAAPSLGERLRSTGNRLGQRLAALFDPSAKHDDIDLEALEDILLTADLGAKTSAALVSQLAKMPKDDPLTTLEKLLTKCLSNASAQINPRRAKPFVVLAVGVNGAGKTTTLGKLAYHWTQQGFSVLLAAGDTFRAAAVQQLQAWGEQKQVQVIAQADGADSAAVIFDALTAAQARGIDIVLADTAGRLHTADHLMAELSKIKRVLQRFDETAPHETLLVLDGTAGQNSIAQAQAFQDAVGINGLVVSKLDGTAKGGALISIVDQLQLPIYFIGVGEGVEDLQVFNPTAYVRAILQRD